MSVLNVYAAKLKDKEALLYSSSGGVFTALSDVFIKQGNAVICVTYDYSSLIPRFQLIMSQEERNHARGSKYIQADMSFVFRESEKWLVSNPTKQLLFFGLGCQAASFLKYMRLCSLDDRVVVVDIICHGAPSPKIWREYVKEVSRTGTMTYVNFRDKREGWSKSVGMADVEGREVSIQSYRRLYSSGMITRPSCYACPYTKMERKTDITIGDYWHIEKVMPDFYDPMGVSLVLIHSEKGEVLFHQAKDDLDYRTSSIKDCWQLNLEKPTSFPLARALFWQDYEANGINSVIKKYGTIKTLPQRAIKKISKLLIGL